MTDREQYIFGTRAVMEAMESGRVIDKILIKSDLSSDMRKELTEMARNHHIPMQRVPV